MAGIDVNAVMLDPLLSTMFDVKRRQEAVGADGRVAISDEYFAGLRGVITWEEGPIMQTPEGVMAKQSIKIATPFSLRDASFGFQPDIVVWEGEEYRITSVKAHRHLGRGWTRATAESTRATNTPPPEGSTA